MTRPTDRDLDLAEENTARLARMLLANDGGEQPEWLVTAMGHSMERNLALFARRWPDHPLAHPLAVLARTSRLFYEWTTGHPETDLSDEECDALWEDLAAQAEEECDGR